MTDYTKLVKALRHCGGDNYSCKGCPLEDCPGYGEWEFAAEALMQEAADAIEELQRIVSEYQKFGGFLAAHGMFEQEPMQPIRDDRGQLLYYPSAEPPKEET